MKLPKRIIDVEHVSKEYSGYTALKEINFKVYEGEIFGFLGPSGAGKTTMIKILTGQLLQTTGKVQVLGIPNQKVTEDIYKKIGIVSDMSGVYERLTVYQNLKFFAKLFEVKEERIDALLKQLGLFEHRKKPASKLSKGMRQRLILARAILHQPKLLFMDEPTSGLDPLSTLAVHEIITQLKEEGTSIFLTTHNMEEAEKLCDRVALLNEGVIEEMDAPENLRLKYNKEKQYEIQLLNGEKQLLEQSPETAELISVWLLADKIQTIHSCEPTLEKVFLEATGRELV